MTLTTALLKAPHVGVRDFKAHISSKMKSHKPIILTDHGEPKQVMMPYDTIIELAEILDELQDEGLMENVRLARQAIKDGFPGIPVKESFDKLRARRKKR